MRSSRIISSRRARCFRFFFPPPPRNDTTAALARASSSVRGDGSRSNRLGIVCGEARPRANASRDVECARLTSFDAPARGTSGEDKIMCRGKWYSSQILCTFMRFQWPSIHFHERVDITVWVENFLGDVDGGWVLFVWGSIYSCCFICVNCRFLGPEPSQRRFDMPNSRRLHPRSSKSTGRPVRLRTRRGQPVCFFQDGKVEG